MIIKGASVFCEDGTFQVKDVFVEDHKIVATEAEVSDKTVVDANGYKLIPGLVDVHSHGACGHDFCDCDVEGVKEILRFEKAHGITSYCPTSMTLSKEMLVDIFATAKEADGIADGARVIGINMEGPFIAPEKKGAQNGAYIQAPSAETFRACQQASGGLIKLVTLAPEMEGSVEFIKELKDEVHISVGHTTADYDTAKAAFEAGADHVTHLYNAMPAFTHRAPGVIGAVADSRHVMVELICDNVHIHPAVVRATFAMMGADRMILISDSMRATGMPDGTYTLGGLDVSVNGNRATLVDGGALAGSVTNLMDCMRTVVKVMKIPLETAVACATANPARCLGVYDTYGSISEGKKADIVLLDEDLELKMVIKDGQLPFL